jgi:hypothetical protein
MLNEPSEKEKKPAPPGWLIENIAEASKNARKIYLIYVAVLAYCALTVVSTTDRQIILNETARLPLVNLDVSLIGFFIIAPLLTIFVFIYFQLYLNRVNRLILDLRTNYLPVEKRRLYPWLLNFAEDPDPGFTGILQNVIVRFSLWWSLPIVLILFSFWFVKKHDPILSYVIGLTPIFGTLIVLYFWFHYEAVQYKLRPERTKFQRFIGKSVLAYFVIIYEIVLLSLIIPESNKGSVVGVDLSYQKLVTEPDVDYEGLYWANLNGFHLEGANLISTVLKRADLRRAHLQNAYLGGANLQEADLWDANLQEAKPTSGTLTFRKPTSVGLTFRKPTSGTLTFRKPTSEELIFRKPTSVKRTFRNPTSVGLIFRKPTSVKLTFRKPTSVELTFRKPASLKLTFRKPTSVGLTFRKPASLKLTFREQKI